ncbi:hypothetical protein PAECIP111893_00403 [Paenibacillus plantiphilus]|uniref:Uncharacterized protein n=1 Tax=Paenibacillus plantiphilus TaxID=2905650 RepID=A0ABN8FVJ2_9BACL|nr:hypothetical protein PAECIP111893_00403 [Paenibacillus plantiphilus]
MTYFAPFGHYPQDSVKMPACVSDYIPYFHLHVQKRTLNKPPIIILGLWKIFVEIRTFVCYYSNRNKRSYLLCVPRGCFNFRAFN